VPEATITPKTNRLRSLRVDEIAFCAQGRDPLARVMLYQAALPGSPALSRHQQIMADVRKWLLERTLPLRAEDEQEPQDFDEIMERRMLHEAASVVMGRLGALDSALWQALFISGTAEEREAAVKRSVEQFQESINADIAGILAGRITSKEPDTMEIDLTKIPQDLRAAVKAAVDQAAKFTALDADHTKLKGENATLTARVAELEKKVEAATPPVDPADDPKVPESVRAALKASRQEAATQKVELSKLQAAQSFNDAAESVRATYPLVADEDVDNALLGRKVKANAALLVAADAAGIGAQVRRVLAIAQEALRKLKVVEEQGGNGDAHSEVRATIHAKVQAAIAANPKLTAEQAEVEVLRQNPDLYTRYLAEHPDQTGARH
jgi:hypothetical protein